MSLIKSYFFIENSAFQDCTSLTSVLLPDELCYIGVNAFENCINLSSISIHSDHLGGIDIRSGAFSNCSQLANIYLPDNLKGIGSYAFPNNGCLTLHVPANSLGQKYAEYYNLSYVID